MQKDLKIGLALGLALVITAVLWLSTRPSLSPKARIQNLHNVASLQEDFGLLEDMSTNKPVTDDNQISKIDHQTESPDSTQYEQAEKIKPDKFHIVLKGQTLSEISYKYYGSAGNWQNIFNANKTTIKDANKLTPGTKLIIPN